MTRGSFARKRPREFDGSSSAELAVLDATERLLGEIPLQDLTVADILRAAGLSRANFYHYFANKYDVLVALVGRAFDESYGSDPPWATSPGPSRAKQMGVSLGHTLDMWSKHGPVFQAVIEHMHSEPSVAAAWQRMFARFVDATAEQISFERDAGRAPDGPPATMVASMLVGGSERVFYVSSRGLDSRLPTIDDVVEPLSAVTEAATYGGRRGDDTGVPTVEGVGVADVADALSSVAVAEPETGTAGSILQAMRELLVDEALDALSVAKILERAGISRASFYFYYRSKEDAFIALFRAAAVGIVNGLSGLAAIERIDPDAFAGQVRQWIDLQGFAGPVIRNAVHVWPRLPELRAEYLGAMNAMESVLEAIITADRAAGTAPGGPPPPQFAATVLWTIERAVAGALAGEEYLDDIDAVIDMVAQLLYASLYGRR
ncbi:TetR/AcrR family transcriptional regulator [Gordonia soli]|uniref:Putative TetR family transcriptional regulator n=1 Tax=Gordonia soli NBRC 108243 TaxID=1223545 RepID=M0QIS2_9ACTN|nr:TetR/AcrR family transcriptional regulator [Gordonia soli]GAC68520.1 putative TetR family transcriptional regulator [Gordonia soli NBRC 108243]